MSEQAATAPSGAETPPATQTPAAQPPAAVATIPADVIQRIHDEAVQKATEAAGRTAQDRLSAAANILQGGNGSQENEINAQVLQRFVNDPVGLLSKIEERAAARGEERAMQKITAAADADRETKAAIKEVLGPRLDVHTEEAMTLIDSFYHKTPNDKPEKERMKLALNKFDLLLEKNGAGDAEKRASAASPSRSASSQPASSARANYNDARSASLEKHQTERIEAYKAKHGGRYPATVK